MTVWSATPYCGEADVLEIRLGTLEGVVDRHVIAEATRNQRGERKPLFFPQQVDRFARWLPQITYLIVNLDDDVGQAADWRREANQRDALSRGLEPEDDDLVFFSDVDEIPFPALLTSEMAAERPLRLEMTMHLYYLNWCWSEKPVRYGTRATLITGRQMRKVPEGHGTPAMIVEAGWPAPTAVSGWHLAYQTDAEGIRAKILSIADDFRQQEYLDLVHLERCRRTGEDLFRREHRHCEWVPDDALPPYVQKNRERFAHMLIPDPVSVAA